MAAVCYAYRLTPDEYRALTLEDHAAFVGLLRDLERERRRG